jgi:hypothetical protein
MSLRWIGRQVSPGTTSSSFSDFSSGFNDVAGFYSYSCQFVLELTMLSAITWKKSACAPSLLHVSLLQNLWCLQRENMEHSLSCTLTPPIYLLKLAIAIAIGALTSSWSVSDLLLTLTISEVSVVEIKCTGLLSSQPTAKIWCSWVPLGNVHAWAGVNKMDFGNNLWFDLMVPLQKTSCSHNFIAQVVAM